MKVLVTDGIHKDAITLLQNSGLEVEDKTGISRDELVQILPNYESIAIRSNTVPDKELLDKGTNLKHIGRIGSGTNHIDIVEATNNGITVTNAPGANSQAVAEQTVAMMISLLRNLGKAYMSMRNGEWAKSELKGGELHGRTVGIIGVGHVGSKVKTIVEAFGANVLEDNSGENRNDFENVLKNSDIMTVHVPLLDSTRGMIGADEFAMMKDGSYIINNARGEVLDEAALYQALESGKLAGAGLDVFHEEPLPADHKLRKMENVFLTPHIGASTLEAQRNASMMVAEDILKLSKGEEPSYVVRP